VREAHPTEKFNMMTNSNQRLTQGQFSFLPDLSDAQITAQLDYALKQGWAIGIEYTDDPHPRNTYWEMFGNPMFDLKDPAGILVEINDCRKTFPRHYIRVTAFDATRGVESLKMSYIVNRPRGEPGFGLARTEIAGRGIRYRVSSYATDRPEGERY
jgi:ribulose-bisphosphate carboxylase small chain